MAQDFEITTYYTVYLKKLSLDFWKYFFIIVREEIEPKYVDSPLLFLTPCFG